MKNTSTITVETYFAVEKITREMVEEIMDESPYWESASLFVLDNWTWRLSEMSAKQMAWLDKILEDMAERRIEGRL